MNLNRGATGSMSSAEHHSAQDEDQHQQRQARYRPLSQSAFHLLQSILLSDNDAHGGLTHDHDVAFRYPRQISSPAPESERQSGADQKGP